MRRPGTPRLVWLACLLPLLALLSAQFDAYCSEQGECAAPVRVGGWLLWPLLASWLAVLGMLALRGRHRLRTRFRR